MTTQDSGNVMRQYFDAISRRDFDAIRKIYHPDYSYTGANGDRQDGPEAGLAVARTYTTAFPDLTFDIRHMHTAGADVVVTEFVVRATHQGELMGIAPTNRSIEVPICNIIELRDGRVYAEREYFDMAHLMQQLGVTAGAAHT